MVQTIVPGGKNKYSDYYIWTDDWTKGGSRGLDAVRGFGQRNGNYINNFFWSQPALNYGFAQPDPAKPWQLPIDHCACRAVRGELIKVMLYWLDRGASGFRVDMASSLVKNDPGKKRTSEFWRGVRAVLDRDYPDAVLLELLMGRMQASDGDIARIVRQIRHTAAH